MLALKANVTAAAAHASGVPTSHAYLSQVPNQQYEERRIVH